MENFIDICLRQDDNLVELRKAETSYSNFAYSYQNVAQVLPRLKDRLGDQKKIIKGMKKKISNQKSFIKSLSVKAQLAQMNYKK